MKKLLALAGALLALAATPAFALEEFRSSDGLNNTPVSAAAPLPVYSPAFPFFNGATGAGSALAGSATYTGAARDAGVSPTPFAYFNCFFLADQAGTANAQGSNDNATWFDETVSTQAVSANTPLILSVPVMTRYHRCKLVNGSSAEGSLYVNSSFTGG